MDKFIETVKNLISSVSEKLSSLYEENKKLFITVSGLILVILICLLLLVITGGKPDKKTKEVPGQSLDLTETLVIPDGPELPREYNTSRKTKPNWTKEEAEPWFTVPSEKEIDDLANSNEKMINEIIGAAP